MDEEEFSLEDLAGGSDKPAGPSQPPPVRPAAQVPVVTTDAAQWRYKVIDAVCVLSTGDALYADAAVDRAKDLLRQKCLALGGNAVVGCSLQVRVRAGVGVSEPAQVAEATAAGTVVLLAPGSLA